VAARPAADGPELHRLVRRRHHRRPHPRPRPALRRLAGDARRHRPCRAPRGGHRPRPSGGVHRLPRRQPGGGPLQHGAGPFPDAGRPTRWLAGTE
jgi:hypothetical protein